VNRLIASLFVAATIIAAVLPPATQAHEKKIEILFSFVATSATHFVGNYSMQGAIYEAGDAEGDSTFYPTKNGGIQDRGDKVLHLTGGDIFMHFESDVEFVGPTALIEEGTWTLTGGTGIYENITGHGKNFILGYCSPACGPRAAWGDWPRASTTARSTCAE
jgi:hypothetical protein